MGGVLIPSVAHAQVIINSTGVVAGTIVPPNRNPNFNNRVTRVDTDAQGRYLRNGVVVYQAPDSRLVIDNNGNYYVDFVGIPVVSTDGTLTSPVLSNGELQLFNRFNHNVPVRFYGTVQDEFVVNGRYSGIVTNPATGDRYQGTFVIRGQGPRYSDPNGGLSPTVFDFQSARSPSVPAVPTVSSYRFSNMPVDLTVTVPAGLQPLSANVPPPPVTNPTSNFSLNTNTNAFFEVSRVVLERQQSAIGPQSRVLPRP
jgi:hypothetical protein